MKPASLIVFLLVQLIAFSQEKSIHIKGRVSCDRGNSGVEHALVQLTLSGGYTFSYKTDSCGRYDFIFGIRTASSCTLTASTNKESKSLYVRDGCFLMSKDQGVITELRDSIEYVKDFVIKAAFCEYEQSPVLFHTNSILSCNDSLHALNAEWYTTFDSIVNQLYHTLKANPTMVLEFTGHASSLEKNAEELSLHRAQLMCALLVSKGINSKRLSAKGSGNRKPLLTEEQIKKIPNKEERTNAHLRNQRIFYRILHWDFKEDLGLSGLLIPAEKVLFY